MFDLRSGLIGGGSTPSDRTIGPGWNTRLRLGVSTPALDTRHDGLLHGIEMVVRAVACPAPRLLLKLGSPAFFYSDNTSPLFVLSFNQSNDLPITT
jgi:hypothetical protein